jgi:hypothetical protein
LTAQNWLVELVLHQLVCFIVWQTFPSNSLTCAATADGVGLALALCPAIQVLRGWKPGTGSGSGHTLLSREVLGLASALRSFNRGSSRFVAYVRRDEKLDLIFFLRYFQVADVP